MHAQEKMIVFAVDSVQGLGYAGSYAHPDHADETAVCSLWNGGLE